MYNVGQKISYATQKHQQKSGVRRQPSPSSGVCPQAAGRLHLRERAARTHGGPRSEKSAEVTSQDPRWQDGIASLDLVREKIGLTPCTWCRRPQADGCWSDKRLTCCDTRICADSMDSMDAGRVFHDTFMQATMQHGLPSGEQYFFEPGGLGLVPLSQAVARRVPPMRSIVGSDSSCLGGHGSEVVESAPVRVCVYVLLRIHVCTRACYLCLSNLFLLGLSRLLSQSSTFRRAFRNGAVEC